MQKRHTVRKLYFHDLEVTSKEYYIDYVSAYTKLTPKSRILEVGCGEGGNLAPFARLGCRVTGIDIAECRIKDAQKFFEVHHVLLVCFKQSDNYAMRHIKSCKECSPLLGIYVLSSIHTRSLQYEPKGPSTSLVSWISIHLTDDP